MDRPRSGEWEWPDVGVYLSERWAEEVPLASFHWAGPVLGPSTQIAILPCPDGGSPLYERETERVLAYALDAARAGRFVEVGCHAGHGRTGMALAALMILAGLDVESSTMSTWESYCDWAIESAIQERYLFDLSKRVARR
ncbi:MAG: protein-tyrosine phosphatase family protein [Actinomycetota bacterium]